MPDWLLPSLAFVGGAFGTWVLIRLRFERFEAMDERREKEWMAWRADLRREIDEIWREIGDHDTGVKGRLHKVENKAQAHEMWLAALERVKTGDR